MGRFYYQDSLGNTSHVTDAVGNLLERYTYSAFGIPTFYNAAGAVIYNAAGISVSALGIRHLFQGQLWTQETGLNDYRNRVELPVMGVFLQPDPLGFKGDAANIYRFCNNNAVNRTDPTGLLDMWGYLRSWFNGVGRSFSEFEQDRKETSRNGGNSQSKDDRTARNVAKKSVGAYKHL
jgi:RHS repeat-associated protein